MTSSMMYIQRPFHFQGGTGRPGADGDPGPKGFKGNRGQRGRTGRIGRVGKSGVKVSLSNDNSLNFTVIC